MAIVGNFLKGASHLAQKSKSAKRKIIQGDDRFDFYIFQQEKQLKKLLAKAKKTEFGEKYGFDDILKSDFTLDAYRRQVPIFQYDYMFQKFWHKTLNGVENVSWPGRITNFALTSGTTGAASKRVPVSKQMIRSIKKTALAQVTSLAELNLPASFYEKHALCVGGSTELKQVNSQFEGDLSGILTGKVPHWLNPYTKPDKKIRAINDWDEKLDSIVENATKWDVAMLCGVPAWVQILIQKVMDYYKTDSIFNIWPNIQVYIHGGVSFEPYRASFDKLFENKVTCLDSYLASEGFIGYQAGGAKHMQLVVDNNIYYEFIPFNQKHFDPEGNLTNFEDALTLYEVEEGVDYALLMSTNSGLFRYLIGDTIRFTDLNQLEFVITGRTKHFLSLCGEHLSVDNMTQAITDLAYKQDVVIDEFAVLGEQNPDGTFTHRWYIATNYPINSINFKYDLDARLMELNDDYVVERQHALKGMEVDVLPTKVFYDFLKIKNKYGSQHKFPRVLKGQLAEDWKNYLEILKEEVRVNR